VSYVFVIGCHPPSKKPPLCDHLQIQWKSNLVPRFLPLVEKRLSCDLLKSSRFLINYLGLKSNQSKLEKKNGNKVDGRGVYPDPCRAAERLRPGAKYHLS
jgi:hypothetical protein